MKAIPVPFNVNPQSAEAAARILCDAPKSETEGNPSAATALLSFVLVTNSWQAPWPISIQDVFSNLTRLNVADFKLFLEESSALSLFNAKKPSKASPSKEDIERAHAYCKNLQSTILGTLTSAKVLAALKKVLSKLDTFLNSTEPSAEAKALQVKNTLKSGSSGSSTNQTPSSRSTGAPTPYNGGAMLLMTKPGHPPQEVSPEDFLNTIRNLIDNKLIVSAPHQGASTSHADKTTVPIFDPQEALSILQKSPPSMVPGEDNAKQKRLLTEMTRTDGLKPRKQFKNLQVLDSLYERFPHFSAVLDFIRKSLALAACGDEGSPARIPPILLRGEPGTGKTYFAHELAVALGTDFFEKDLSVATEAFVISGLDSSWKAAKPGVVFDALVNGECANPLICLDEVDKCKETGTNLSPIAALYSLLEPSSSKRFKDEFIPVSVDASHIMWVLTANDGNVPAPILSRLEIFDIPVPTKDQATMIAQSVWTSVCAEVLPKGHGFSEELSSEVAEFMGSLSPRIMRKALTYAASTAALNGRKTLDLTDLTASASRYNKTTKSSIGFMRD